MVSTKLTNLLVFKLTLRVCGVTNTGGRMVGRSGIASTTRRKLRTKSNIDKMARKSKRINKKQVEGKGP